MTPEIPFLDRMLDAEDAAKWLQMEERDFQEKTRKKVIPAFRFGHKTYRYNPRTIIAKMAQDAGVSQQTIIAMLNTTQVNPDR